VPRRATQCRTEAVIELAVGSEVADSGLDQDPEILRSRQRGWGLGRARLDLGLLGLELLDESRHDLDAPGPSMND
jgi:hypothetical protein